jgi:hypothetical protein
MGLNLSPSFSLVSSIRVKLSLIMRALSYSSEVQDALSVGMELNLGRTDTVDGDVSVNSGSSIGVGVSMSLERLNHSFDSLLYSRISRRAVDCLGLIFYAPVPASSSRHRDASLSSFVACRCTDSLEMHRYIY